MIKIFQYNKERLSKHYSKQVTRSNSGIQCEYCDGELYYTNPDVFLLSNPPQQELKCKKCSQTQYVFV